MSNKALSEEELDQLNLFLRQAKGNMEDVEKLDGFFCALICGPELILPGEYFPQILGKFDFGSEEQAENIVDLIFKHWNFIVGELASSLSGPGAYLPIFMEDENGHARGNDWAKGFMTGLQMRPGSWDELINDEEHAGVLIPIMMLQHENDPDPGMQPAAITDEKREIVLEMLSVGLSLIYKYFVQHRDRVSQASSHTAVHRNDWKTGLNDPCPCNSGRKFKRCCADEYATLH